MYTDPRGIPGDWRGTPEHGGGMILDWGIHLIDQIMGIVDDKNAAEGLLPLRPYHQ